MGTLSEIARKSTGKLGGDMISDRKRGSPLRKIVKILRVTNDVFDQSKVLLECGHTAKSNANTRARCWKCKENEPPDKIE